jgi:hypothetical protein
LGCWNRDDQEQYSVGNGDDLVNLTATYSDIEDGDPGEGNISTNPMFGNPRAMTSACGLNRPASTLAQTMAHRWWISMETPTIGRQRGWDFHG